MDKYQQQMSSEIHQQVRKMNEKQPEISSKMDHNHQDIQGEIEGIKEQIQDG